VNKYEVKLEGTNFLFNQDGEHRKYGFHARVIVRAKDPDAAAKMAVILVRRNPLIKDALVDESSVRSEIRPVEVKKANPLHFLLKKSAAEIEFHPEEEV